MGVTRNAERGDIEDLLRNKGADQTTKMTYGGIDLSRSRSSRIDHEDNNKSGKIKQTNKSNELPVKTISLSREEEEDDEVD